MYCNVFSSSTGPCDPTEGKVKSLKCISSWVHVNRFSRSFETYQDIKELFKKDICSSNTGNDLMIPVFNLWLSPVPKSPKSLSIQSAVMFLLASALPCPVFTLMLSSAWPHAQRANIYKYRNTNTEIHIGKYKHRLPLCFTLKLQTSKSGNGNGMKIV